MSPNVVVPGLLLLIFLAVIVIYFVHLNNKWNMLYLVVKFTIIIIIALYLINLVFLPDFSFLKTILTLWPGVLIFFGVSELLSIHRDKRKLASAGFFITFGAIYQYINYQSYILDKPSQDVMGIFGLIGALFWPLFAVGVLVMIIILLIKYFNR